jgi:hypothetical protein
LSNEKEKGEKMKLAKPTIEQLHFPQSHTQNVYAASSASCGGWDDAQLIAFDFLYLVTKHIFV